MKTTTTVTTGRRGDDDDDDENYRGEGRPRPCPTPPKFKKCSVFNENRYLDHIRCGESENDNPDGQRQRGGAGTSNRC